MPHNPWHDFVLSKVVFPRYRFSFPRCALPDKTFLFRPSWAKVLFQMKTSARALLTPLPSDSSTRIFPARLLACSSLSSALSFFFRSTLRETLPVSDWERNDFSYLFFEAAGSIAIVLLAKFFEEPSPFYPRRPLRFPLFPGIFLDQPIPLPESSDLNPVRAPRLLQLLERSCSPPSFSLLRGRALVSFIFLSLSTYLYYRREAYIAFPSFSGVWS